MSRDTFITADQGHLAEVAALYTRVIDDLLCRGIHQWQHGVYPTRASAEAALGRGDLYVCLRAGEIAAAVVVNREQAAEWEGVTWRASGPAMALHTLVVAPRFARQGLGRAAVAFAADTARAAGCKALRLDLYPGNPAAVGLYRSMGFAKAGRVLFGIKEPGHEGYDCYELAL